MKRHGAARFYFGGFGILRLLFIFPICAALFASAASGGQTVTIDGENSGTRNAAGNGRRPDGNTDDPLERTDSNGNTIEVNDSSLQTVYGALAVYADNLEANGNNVVIGGASQVNRVYGGQGYLEALNNRVTIGAGVTVTGTALSGGTAARRITAAGCSGGSGPVAGTPKRASAPGARRPISPAPT